MKKVENYDKILEIMKSESLAQSRLEFMEKFSVNSDSIFVFNTNFSKWRKTEIDTRGFVDSIVKANLSFNVSDFSIFDLILEYLKIHLHPIKDLIDENPDDVINVASSLRDNYLNIDDNLGSKEVTPELSDDVYNPFDKPELIIDEVINVLNVKFASREYRERFYDVCTKFIKNIRNKIQTFEILVKDKKNNGVGLDKNIADEVLNKIEKIKKQGEESLLSAQYSVLSTQLGEQSTKIEGTNLGDGGVDDLDIGEHKEPVIDSRFAIKKDDDSSKKNIIEEYVEGDMKFHVFDGSVEEMYLNQIKNKEEISDMSSANSHSNSKNIKLIGPIEELAFFTIKDFRNLDQDVEKRATRIEKKIKVLSSYSARKKVLGIKAWLSSEVCLVYKKMIDESVKYGDMNRVILLRKEKGDLYLTSEEIDAIAQLNRKLRI